MWWVRKIGVFRVWCRIGDIKKNLFSRDLTQWPPSIKTITNNLLLYKTSANGRVSYLAKVTLKFPFKMTNTDDGEITWWSTFTKWWGRIIVNYSNIYFGVELSYNFVVAIQPWTSPLIKIKHTPFNDNFLPKFTFQSRISQFCPHPVLL